MQIIKSKDELLNAIDNQFIGCLPQMKNSKFIFHGKNNILFCEASVELTDSIIEFGGDNSIIFLGKSCHKYKAFIKIFNNSVVYFDRNNYFNKRINVIASEECNLIVGRDCMFASGISMMTTDHHPIFDISSLKRTNYSKSIYIGDHVWIGKNSMILKGTKIDSGSIIGAMSLVSGKSIEHNSIYAGNPARRIKSDIFWNGVSVHNWGKKEILDNSRYSNFINKKEELLIDDFIYANNVIEEVDYNYIEQYLRNHSIYEKLNFLEKLLNNSKKNRFTHNDKL